MHDVRISFGIDPPTGQTMTASDVAAIVPPTWQPLSVQGVAEKYARVLVLLTLLHDADNSDCCDALTACAGPLSELDRHTLDGFRSCGVRFQLIVSSFSDVGSAVLAIDPVLSRQLDRLNLSVELLFETA